MATVVKPPSWTPPTRPPSTEELEALIEEARRRQLRRRRRVGAALLLGAAAFGLGLYLSVADVGGGSSPAHPRRPAAVPSATRPEIVFAADRAAVRYGEIYIVDSSGKRIDLSRSPAQDISPTFSPNGRWVAFLSNRSGEGALYAVRTTGGPVVKLLPGLVPGFGLQGQVVWSPDGRRLAVAASNGSSSSVLYLTGLDGHGTAVDRDFADELTWSPGGRELAYRANREVHVVDRTGFPEWQLRTSPRSLSWSKSGRLAVDDGQKARVYDRNGRLVATSARRPASPTRAGIEATSADGSRIAMVSSTGELFSLKVSRPHGSGARTVARAKCNPDNGSPFSAVQFAPDGRRLLYQTSCGEPSANVYAVLPDGTRLRRLTETSSNQTGPALSPDARAIAFSEADAAGLACKGCPSAIWTMDATGGHREQLTRPDANSGTQDGQPSWSPDARRIVFSRSDFFSPATLYVVPATGGRARALHVEGSSPAWGPSKIAYLGNDGVWTVRPDGTGAHLVVRARDTSVLAWSKGGSLAYLSRHGSVIHLLGAKGQHSSFRVPGRADALTWSPDGTRLLVSASKGVFPSELYTVDARGGRFTQLTTSMGSIQGMSWR
jgi:Tol biopolymer transport system component